MTGRARLVWTTSLDGDLAVQNPGEALDRRRRRIVDHPWTWLHQVHGAGVVTVAEPGGHAGAEADAAVTDVPGAVLAVHTADCVPVALIADGAVGVVHAGWRGLAEGVVDGALAAMRAMGAGRIQAEIGPCIRARCYEFGAGDLETVAAGLGDSVRSTTAWGAPALDMPAGVRTALTTNGVADIIDRGTCTACSPVHFSYRARRDSARQALVAWLAP